MENNRTKPQTLKNTKDFQDTYKKGQRVFQQNWLTLNFKANESECLRVGWTIPRFVGCAVVRNKLKRWLREIMRKDLQSFNTNLDINFVFRRNKKEFYKDLQFSSFRDNVLSLVKKAEKRYQ